MNIAELAATLGWDVDFETIARYQSELNRSREATKQLEADTKKLAAAESLAAEMRGRGIGPGGGGDPARALALISPGAPGAGGATVADRAAGSTRGWGRALEIANAGLGVALKGYTIVSSVVGQVSGAFKAAAAEAGHYNDAAARLGISVEAVQELGFAASQSGSDLDTLTGGLGKLADKVDAAKKGGKDAAASLRAVGVSASDLRSGKTSLDAALGEIADKFAAMPDGAKKSALAVDLFGGAGAKLIPLLNKGSKGIGELRAEAQRLGVVMSGDTAQGLADLGDQQAKLGDQLAGIRNQVIAALVPLLTELASGLSAWLTENRETIVEVLTVVGKGVVYILQGLGYLARGLATVVGWVIENWKPVAAALALAFWPLTLAALGIYAIIKAFPILVDGAEAAGEAIGDAFVAAAAAIVGAAKAIGRAFAAVWDAIKSLGRAIGGFFADVGRGIRSAFGAVVDWFTDRINDLLGVINKAIRLYNKIPLAPDIPEVGMIGGGQKTAAIAPRGAGATVNNNIAGITVNAAPGQDEQQVAVNVRRELSAALREAATGVA